MAAGDDEDIAGLAAWQPMLSDRPKENSSRSNVMDAAAVALGDFQRTIGGTGIDENDLMIQTVGLLSLQWLAGDRRGVVASLSVRMTMLVCTMPKVEVLGTNQQGEIRGSCAGESGGSRQDRQH
jgi:hypothetical protein